MKKILCFIAIALFITLTACNITDSGTKDFAIETVAMTIGYEMREGFVWSESVDRYYNAIMEGKMSLDAAQAAESYLREVTHPLIANRLVVLAGKVGFDMNEAGKLVGVDKVNIHLLQVAAQGFRQGLLLE